MKAALTTIATAILSLTCIAQTTYYTPVLVDTVDPTPNYNGYSPVVFNNRLFFCNEVQAGPVYKRKDLYATDGTTAGTKLLKDAPGKMTGLEPLYITPLGNKLLFASVTANDKKLFVSDGTTAGTQPLLNINSIGDDDVNFITAVGSKAFFFADDGVHGTEPWVTDGTATGTQMLKDIDANAGWGPLCEATCSMNGLFYFFVTNGVTGELELWASDGTTTGTVKVLDFTGVAYPHAQQPMVVNGTLYFSLQNAGATELWATSGAIGDVRKIGILGNGNCTGYYAELNGQLYFTQYDGNNTILWMTDGVQLTPLKQGPKPPHPAMNNVIAFNGYIYFNYNDGNVGTEIWRTDGVTANMYKDVWPGVNSGGGAGFTIAGGMLYFCSYRPGAAQLFCTDGNGFVIHPVFPIGMTPGWGADDYVGMGGFMTAMNDTLYYAGRYDNSGWGLYKVRKVIVNSVSMTSNEMGVQLYPNPTTGKFSVELTTGNIREVEVCDALGRRVYKHAGNHAQRIELSLPATLSNGSYTLRIATRDGIVKQRLELNR
jgi:ELWxxDGT repeat protein